MADEVFQPPSALQKTAHIKAMEQYNDLYKTSLERPVEFWLHLTEKFYWDVPPTRENALKFNFDHSKGPIAIQWFADGKTNICYNALDRIVDEKGMGDKIAFYWEGNCPDDRFSITYSHLLKLVNQFSHVLRQLGLKKGDRVAIYMPMIIELVIAMLSCARLGIVHSIVFGGFSAEALADRMVDARCSLLVTCDGVYRGAKLVHLKEAADQAMTICLERGLELSKCIVVQHVTRKGSCSAAGSDGYRAEAQGQRPAQGLKVEMRPERDLWWHDLMSSDGPASNAGPCPVEWMNAEDPLFMLYTSGSTGKPKGVLHTTAGYMVYVGVTFLYTFDYHDEDIFWCTADIGWITGHSYVVYGPMMHGATSVLFEGIPTWPDPGRCWAVVDRYKVTTFYTAPTAIRSLIKTGDSYVKQYSRQSLKILGTVGEPINPDAWLWYYHVVGDSKCPVVDTFWQTETGGHAITPLPGATPTKPGSAALPFFGVEPCLLSEDGEEITGPGEGYLVFKRPWPGIMRTVYGDQARFEATYFKKFKGYYTTGDGARRDADGYYWITGRIDDMLNVSGHLLSTAEMESALVNHPSVAEAAVVGRPHDVKGECTYCFVTLKNGHVFTPGLVIELVHKVRDKIGPFAAPEFVQDAPGLPKTRSGKIMRRILRKIAINDHELGDITTLADTAVVEQLFNLRCPEATTVSSELMVQFNAQHLHHIPRTVHGVEGSTPSESVRERRAD